MYQRLFCTFCYCLISRERDFCEAAKNTELNDPRMVTVQNEWEKLVSLRNKYFYLAKLFFANKSVVVNKQGFELGFQIFQITAKLPGIKNESIIY